MYLRLGVQRENILIVDTDGVIYKGRDRKHEPVQGAVRGRHRSARTLAEAMRGADVFVGLSAGGQLTRGDGAQHGAEPDHLRAGEPGSGDHVGSWRVATRPDAIIATGRSDYPNQVNNVLGFPFIFRGALDVRASAINEEMKMAATRALAALAKEDVPESVLARVRPRRSLQFGPRLPHPLAVRSARAAVGGAGGRVGGGGERRRAQAIGPRGVPRALERTSDRRAQVMQLVVNKARSSRRAGIVFPEGEDERSSAPRGSRRRGHRAPDPARRPRVDRAARRRSSASTLDDVDDRRPRAIAATAARLRGLAVAAARSARA